MDYLNRLKDLIGLNDISSMCPKNSKSFHTFFVEKRRVECKIKTCLAKKVCGLMLRTFETYARKARDL